MARDPIRSYEDHWPFYFEARRGLPGFAEDRQGKRRWMLDAGRKMLPTARKLWMTSAISYR
ncbi:Protein CBG12378 [Caenorhabditis briggsae]|uniref:Protein CBG12378 n=1 Tax=Caenorhabditis briggsae TaxID=6238 RepID=A8XFA5_CAEBR|nr:Protein CBG12378 [Caenorhabditis briggsae]CAP31366.1 Protein CBG12378 [Caenorhabditis briggsae]